MPRKPTTRKKTPKTQTTASFKPLDTTMLRYISGAGAHKKIARKK